jgi:stage II sporulation protein D
MHRLIRIAVSIFVLLTASSFFMPVDHVQIRIFSAVKVNAMHAEGVKGTYRLFAEGNVVALKPGVVSVDISVKNDSMEITEGGKLVSRCRFAKLFCIGEGEVAIRVTDPERKQRIYPGNISVSISEGSLRVINEVELDAYIAGVTEAEAGARTYQEFYKVQAILARTFALGHINKHVTEGFSLCDQVHCQAYYGKPRDLSIVKAVQNTKGKVVVDDNLNLITAAFHSNSGGQTANSEDVWGSRTSYLRSIEDTFSTRMPNSHWERKMPVEDWLSYLRLKHNYPVDNEDARVAALNFTQQQRKSFLEISSCKVPLKSVRQDFQLKSTFFSIAPLGSDTVIFRGRGYGHGLGMCQEGAMRMARLGYNYIDILNFYYKDIQLMDLHKLSFFKDE